MPGLTRWILSISVSFLVAAPLLYFHIVGRQAPLIVGYCGTFGPLDQWRYGWPVIYGTRIIHEPWLGHPGTTGPLEDFNAGAVFWNLSAAAVMIAGTIYVALKMLSALRDRQFSLRSLMLLPVVTAAVCTFIQYDRSPNLIFFLVPSTPERFDPAADPIVFRPQAVTDFPPYLYVPIIIGVASATYAVLTAAGAIVAFLCRAAFCGSSGPTVRNARWRLLATMALICLLLGATHTARGAYRLRADCHAAVSGRLATEWLSMYVFLHGEWPRSWDAIRACLKEQPLPDRNEEGLIEMVQAYIAIDFRADARAVARQTAGEFDSIRTLDERSIDHRDYWQVETLIDELQMWTDAGKKRSVVSGKLISVQSRIDANVSRTTPYNRPGTRAVGWHNELLVACPAADAIRYLSALP